MPQRVLSVFPNNIKYSYTEGDTLDFDLDHKDASLIANSIRFNCELRVQDNNAYITNQRINYTHKIGAHSFIERITTRMNNGLVENFGDYPRYVNMVAGASLEESDMFNSQQVCELRMPNAEAAQVVLKGVGTDVANSTVNNVNDFSIKPNFCLNRVSGNTLLPYNKTGTIRISIQLARIVDALHGAGVGSNTTYILMNPEIQYRTVNGSGSGSGSGSTVFATKLNIKQTIQSSFANISTKVPAICSGCSVSFQQTAREHTAQFDNQNLEELPNITKLQFLFNDNLNQSVSYQIQE